MVFGGSLVGCFGGAEDVDVFTGGLLVGWVVGDGVFVEGCGKEVIGEPLVLVVKG